VLVGPFKSNSKSDLSTWSTTIGARTHGILNGRDESRNKEAQSNRHETRVGRGNTEAEHTQREVVAVPRGGRTPSVAWRGRRGRRRRCRPPSPRSSGRAPAAAPRATPAAASAPPRSSPAAPAPPTPPSPSRAMERRYTQRELEGAEEVEEDGAAAEGG
jgi:hypothetical protein